MTVRRALKPLLTNGPLLSFLDLQARWARRAERRHLLMVGRPQPSDAILLVGSGRSGTTWISQVIAEVPGITQIFEPLYPRWIAEARKLPGQITGPYPSAMGVRLTPESAPDDWLFFLERMLRGEVRGHWTDKLGSVHSPKRYLIKLIRANMMLGVILDRFSPSVLYVTRHPCACIASRLARGWVSDTEPLLAQPLIRDGVLKEWVDDVRSERREAAKHAIWWAVENALAMHDLSTRTHMHVTYENILLSPEYMAGRILQFLGEPIPDHLNAALERPSELSRPEATYTSIEHRLTSWRTELKANDIDGILMWSERLGIKLYDDDPLPHKNAEP